jgi:hypothetical protein
MPLIDLQTNLKNLRFGNDRPGYGSSGLPYIQTIIPDTPNATGTFQPIYRPGSTGGLDFPIRGGQLEFNLGSQSFTVSSRLDRSRIRKFFEDKPRGTAFIQKQVGLQLSNPKIETGNTLFGIPQGLPFPGLLENTRVYNLGANTLAQVGVSGTGFHAIRHGLIPFNPFQKFYYDIVNKQNVTNQKSSNRLYNLLALKMTTGDPFVNRQNVPDINLVNTLGISLNRNMIFQYLGGPNSVYGIGSTTIPRVVDTTKLVSTRAMTYDQLYEQNINITQVRDPQTDTNDYIKETRIQDFRKSLPALDDTYTPWGDNSVDGFYTYNVASGKYGSDKMNLMYPFLFNNLDNPWDINKEDSKDLIKFVFEAISNDNPSVSTAIFFRAFLTAGITDNNSAELNSFKYIGRGENFFTYQGFTRSVGFSFRVAAQSKQELRPMYNRLNMLLGQVYPDYSANQGIMRAPVVRVTIGDYLYRVPGFIESINLTVDNDMPWEINLDGDLAQLPQVVDVAVIFRPILDVLPKRPSTEVTTVSTSPVTINAAGRQIATTLEQVEQNTTVGVNPLIGNVPNDFISTDLNGASINTTSIRIAQPVRSSSTVSPTATTAVSTPTQTNLTPPNSAVTQASATVNSTPKTTGRTASNRGRQRTQTRTGAIPFANPVGNTLNRPFLFGGS